MAAIKQPLLAHSMYRASASTNGAMLSISLKIGRFTLFAIDILRTPGSQISHAKSIEYQY
ncbi:hypothetical protein DML75_19790 [Salmonella enterica subsp. enterica serovar Typhimurium]|uniref:Uncharacterized protein n=1 Tax=Salmonella enterica TaxID=28901 RepID=A0A5T8GVN7_SALER|nr:hypothetical protein [Salmonella enterica]ECS9431608.1 hypothetical protein [Salmonella enterica subsp. enterica serovar Typhimurium]ECU2627360.1 hypothetical protein [Salmonella enterica subsp. enterica serovar Typhimurium]